MSAVLNGNVLLFKSTGKWYEQVICRVTGGPFCHVEVALTNTSMIGARVDGINVHPLPTDTEPYVAIDILPYVDGEADIARALTWALAQRGKQYGWTDIVWQAVKFLAPNNPLRWGVEGRWDCSDLVTRYLQQAGVILPEEFSDPYCNTPCDIGRIFGVLLPRKQDHACILPIPQRSREGVR